MFLTKTKNELKGYYYYDKYKKNINLNGFIDESMHFTLNEYNNSEIIGTFQGELNIVGGELFSGTWSNTDRSKILDFLIYEPDIDNS